MHPVSIHARSELTNSKLLEMTGTGFDQFPRVPGTCCLQRWCLRVLGTNHSWGRAFRGGDPGIHTQGQRPSHTGGTQPFWYTCLCRDHVAQQVTCPLVPTGVRATWTWGACWVRSYGRSAMETSKLPFLTNTALPHISTIFTSLTSIRASTMCYQTCNFSSYSTLWSHLQSKTNINKEFIW